MPVFQASLAIRRRLWPGGSRGPVRRARLKVVPTAAIRCGAGVTRPVDSAFGPTSGRAFGIASRSKSWSEQLCSGDAVDRRVMHLRDECDVPVLQAFDDVHLPERLGAVELAAADVADELGELGMPPGAGRARRRRWKSMSKWGSSTQYGVPEAEWDLNQPPGEHGSLDEPPVDQVADLFEGITAA